MKFPEGGSPTAAEDAFARTPRIAPGPGVTVVLEDTVALGPHEARRLVVRKDGKSQVSLMTGIGSRRVMLAMVAGDQSVDHTDPKVKAFFDNLTLRQ